MAAARLARGMCGVFARLPAVEWLASVLLVGESEALELVLSGFEGDQGLARARSGWLACVFVGGLGARPENEPDPRPTIAGVTTMSPPLPISFQVRFRVRVVTMVVVGLIVVFPEVW